METRSQGAGVVFDFERAAMNGDELPGGLSQEEQLLFLSLRELYAQKRAGFISREQGSSEKKKLVAEFNRRVAKSDFGKRCSDHSVRLWRAVEVAANEFAKTKSLDAAERMYRAIYGIREEVSQDA